MTTCIGREALILVKIYKTYIQDQENVAQDLTQFHVHIVAKKRDPGILDPEPFLAQIRKVEARLGKLAKIRKVETD